MKNKKVTGPYLVEKLLETLTKMKNFEVFFGNCYCDPDSTSKVKRWDNKSKTYIDINCPTAVQEYNKSMEGVDLADTLFVLYRTTIKSKGGIWKSSFIVLILPKSMPGYYTNVTVTNRKSLKNCRCHCWNLHLQLHWL